MQRVPLAIDWPALISPGGYSDEPCVKCRCKTMSWNSCAICLNAVFAQGIVGILSVFCIYQCMYINQPSIHLSLWSFINLSSHLWVCPSILIVPTSFRLLLGVRSRVKAGTPGQSYADRGGSLLKPLAEIKAKAVVARQARLPPCSICSFVDFVSVQLRLYELMCRSSSLLLLSPSGTLCQAHTGCLAAHSTHKDLIS